jgi:hypothetical protein
MSVPLYLLRRPVHTWSPALYSIQDETETVSSLETAESISDTPSLEKPIGSSQSEQTIKYGRLLNLVIHASKVITL